VEGEAGTIVPLHLRPAQQLRELGDAGGDAPGLVAREEVRRRAASRLILEVDVGERLPVAVADDEGMYRSAVLCVAALLTGFRGCLLADFGPLTLNRDAHLLRDLSNSALTGDGPGV
jgi:hypothetical protein